MLFKKKAVKTTLIFALVAIILSGTVRFNKTNVKADGENYVPYVLEDNFASLNQGNWSVYQRQYLTSDNPPEYIDVVNISSGITFTNDFTLEDDGYDGARVSSNVYFADDPQNTEVHTVFETSFSVYQNNKENRRVPVSFGILFGMSTKNAKIVESSYFEFDSFCFYLNVKGERKEPIYLTDVQKNDFGGYIEYDCKLQARLVATSNGELTVYFAFPDGKTMDKPFCKFTGLDFDGYLGFMGTSKNPKKPFFSLSFDSIRLNGTAVCNNDFTVISCEPETQKLNTAVVSDKPIELTAKVVTSPNLPEYHRVTYSVISGNAEIKGGNKLYVNGEGEITVRAKSFYNPDIYSDYTFIATDLKISGIEFVTKFENVTVYTQPIRLTARVTSNSYVPAHNEAQFEVVSGPAEIFCGKYLKITGTGTVTVKAKSAILENETTISFTVTDPDEGAMPRKVEPKAQGCGGSVNASSLLTLLGILSIIKLKKK